MRSGTLRMSVTPGHPDRDGHGSAFLAKVELLVGVDGSRFATRHVLLRPTRVPVTLDVPPGLFGISVTLPSGQIVEERAEVVHGVTVDVSFDRLPSWRDIPETVAEASSHDAAGTDVVRALDWLLPLIGPPEDAPVGDFDLMELQAAGDDDRPRPAPPPPAKVVAQRCDDVDSVWIRLAAGCLPFPDDAASALMDAGFVTIHDVHDLAVAPDRVWLTTTSPRGQRCAGLLPDLGEVANEVRLHVGISDDACGVDVAVDDPEFGGLFDYFTSGRMVAASTMLAVLREDAATSDRLSRNAVSSCMAGYIDLAVGTPMLAVPDQGVGMLADVCVIKAKTLLTTYDSGHGHLDEALAEAKRAYRSGVPLFGIGVVHLREVLEAFVEEDEEAAAMAARVSRVANRIDASRPFTALRYGASERRFEPSVTVPSSA